MDLKIPGLSEALDNLKDAGQKMAELSAGIATVIELLEEQNRILSDREEA